MESSPAAAAEQEKFTKYRLKPSRQTENIDLAEAKDTAIERVPVFTRNHANAIAMNSSARAADWLPNADLDCSKTNCMA